MCIRSDPGALRCYPCLAEDRVQEFCQRVRENLTRLDFQEKQQALEALSIRVAACRWPDRDPRRPAYLRHHCTNIGMTTWT